MRQVQDAFIPLVNLSEPLCHAGFFESASVVCDAGVQQMRSPATDAPTLFTGACSDNQPLVAFNSPTQNVGEPRF